MSLSVSLIPLSVSTATASSLHYHTVLAKSLSSSLVDFFEIHVNARSEAVAGLCHYVRSAVLVGLDKAAATLHYTNSNHEIAFPCPCDQGAT